jgi:dienelactone hydrolase
MLAVTSSGSLRAALLALVMVAACAPPRQPPVVVPLAPPAADLRENVEQRAVSIAKGWITVNLVIPREPAGPKPAIVSPTDDEQALLDRGIVLVRFHTNWELLRGFAQPAASDASTAAEGAAQAAQAEKAAEGKAPPAPQNQVGAWLLAAPRPGIVGKAYFALISEDALHSLPQVMDYLQTVPEIDATRIAIAGSSTSGFVALEALARDARFAAAVVRVACGDYHAFLRSSSLALNNEARWLPDGRLELDPDYEAVLQEIEPIRAANRFPPRPLLMLNGAQDKAIPLDCAQHTADALRAAYARQRVPERFRFVVHPDQGHDLGPEAADESLAWWDHWLLARPLVAAGGL